MHFLFQLISAASSTSLSGQARIGGAGEGAIQLQPREISLIIVWQTVTNEKFKISAGIRSQLVHTDLFTQDRYPPPPWELNKQGPISGPAVWLHTAACAE